MSQKLSEGFSASGAEMEGWLKKKSPKTQGKKEMDVWQKRYFVLIDGALRYYKSESAAASGAVALKSILLNQVLSATTNPRHPNMFIVDMGQERKVKLQAASETECDGWVRSLEAAKLRAWAAQEESAFDDLVQDVRASQALASASASGQGGARAASPGPRTSPENPAGTSKSNPKRNEIKQRNERYKTELLHKQPASKSKKNSCCIIS